MPGAFQRVRLRLPSYRAKCIRSTPAPNANADAGDFSAPRSFLYTFSSCSILANPTHPTAMGRYPWAEVILFEILFIAILCPTRHHAYRVAVFAAMVYVATPIYMTREVTDPLILTYTVGCMVGGNFMFITYLFFAEGSFPDNWRRVRDEVHAKADVDGLPSNFPLAKKLWWMLDLAHSSRMVGWVQEPRNAIPPHPPPSRRTFLWKTLLKFIGNAIISDFTRSVFALSPAFDNRLHDPTDGPETYLAAVPLLRRVPYVLSYPIRMRASMGLIHNALALVCVGLCNSSPTLWPDLWGRWRDAYTLRRLWGYVRS